MKRVLSLSSSRVGKGGYLQAALPIIQAFLEDKQLNVAFVPFAAVDTKYDEYGNLVRKALAELQYTINTVLPGNAKRTIEQSDVVMVGGGNTFKLLHDLYDLELLELIRTRVTMGTPYIGWSAGSNITGLTIGTTNDMPIIEPKTFKALGLLPFQINPHYINQVTEDHNGETRDQRLLEFVTLNPGIPVLGLPEGTALQLSNGVLTFLGQSPGMLFQSGENTNEPIYRKVATNENLSFLL